jgi:uncharacterized protein (TIGR02466 family)
MAIKAWFPTFIYQETLRRSGAAFNRELLEESYQIRDYDDAGRKWSKKNYPGGYTSYGSMSQLHKFSSTFGELETQINRHVKRYVKHLEMNLEGKRFEMTDCWVNIMPRHVVHGLHLHPLSFISGTYYVKTPRNCSSIKFEDPRLSKFMAAPPKLPDCVDANRQHIRYPAEAGKVILFESWLRHEVASNPTTEDRVSISFNYNWF